jgi:hypothetical protein
LPKASVHPKSRPVASDGIHLLALRLHSQRNCSRLMLHSGRSNRRFRGTPRCPILFPRLRSRQLRGRIRHHRANSEPCDVNSLIPAGTKTRAGHLAMLFRASASTVCAARSSSGRKGERDHRARSDSASRKAGNKSRGIQRLRS